VTYRKNKLKWKAQRRSSIENTMISYGCYDTETEAAHASDTLARKLMENGEQAHKLNFPDDETDVHKKRGYSQYIGVTYAKNISKWKTQRYSKNENKAVSNGYYDTEEAAAYASDILASKLMESGEQCHKLNFPDDDTEENREHKKKRKRFESLECIQDN